MQPYFSSARFRLIALGTIILVAGLFMVYLVKTRAGETEASQYRLIAGHAFLSESNDSKQDADGRQKYGGNIAVIVAAYKRRLHNLLQGKSLATLLAIATIVLAAGCFWKAWEAD